MENKENNNLTNENNEVKGSKNEKLNKVAVGIGIAAVTGAAFIATGAIALNNLPTSTSDKIKEEFKETLMDIGYKIFNPESERFVCYYGIEEPEIKENESVEGW